MPTTQKEIESHFTFQEKYYNYLKKKLGDLFKGEARKANGMIKTGAYYKPWDYLSTIEGRSKIRRIAIRCMKGKKVKMKIRSGESYMEAITNDELFPKMKPTRYLNDRNYGRKPIDYPIFIWKVNEVCGIMD